MGIYRDTVFPRLCDLTMRNALLGPYRERVIGRAERRVLEIGAGSGLNFPLYRAAVTEVLALEPDHKLTAMAGCAAKNANRPVTFLEASAEAIPLENGSVNTVVTTWTLCSIPNAVRALEEMRRVLRPGGHLLFVEHGVAPDAGVRKWQNRLTPIWKRLSGGCHLNRPIDKTIEDGGFNIRELHAGYADGPKLLTFFYEGIAQPR